MKRKICFFVCMAAIAMTAFAGGRSSTSAPAAGAAPGGKPVLSITVPYHVPEAPNHQGILNKLEQMTGYKIDFNWVPSSAYTEKTNTMMASDSLTDMVVQESDLKTTSFLNAVREGIFWELDDYINDYPNLVKIGAKRFDNVRRGGKIIAIPRSRDLVRHGINYRQDWAEEAGFTNPPTTMEEIDRMARAFAKRPGMQFSVTQGISGPNPAIPPGLDYTAVWMGAPLNYGFDKNGNLTHAWLTDEYTQTVDMWRSWYADGVFNKNFIEINSDAGKDYIITQEGGIVFLTVDDIRSRFMDLYVNNPSARLWYAINVNNRTIATLGYNGGITFSKTAANEEKLRHCLQWINNLGDPAYQTIRQIGLEGEHYTIIDGVAVQTQEQLDAFARNGTSYSLFNVYVGVVTEDVPMKFPDNFNAYRLEHPKYADTCIMDPTIPHVSNTYTTIGISELDPIRCDAINRYIIGSITKAQYQEAQQRWLAAGGAQVTKEFDDLIKASR